MTESSLAENLDLDLTNQNQNGEEGSKNLRYPTYEDSVWVSYSRYHRTRVNDIRLAIDRFLTNAFLPRGSLANDVVQNQTCGQQLHNHPTFFRRREAFQIRFRSLQ